MQSPSLPPPSPAALAALLAAAVPPQRRPFHPCSLGGAGGAARAQLRGGDEGREREAEEGAQAPALRDAHALRGRQERRRRRAGRSVDLHWVVKKISKCKLNSKNACDLRVIAGTSKTAA